MCSQSKGIDSANISASMCGKIRTIPALLHCVSRRRDNSWLDCGLPNPIGVARSLTCYLLTLDMLQGLLRLESSIQSMVQEARRATGRPAGMQAAWGLLYDTPIASMVALPSLYLNDLEHTYESFRPIQFPPGTDLRRKCIVSLLYRIPLTPQVAGINNTDQIEKRFTAPVFRQGTNRNRNRESLSGGGTLGRRNERYQRVSYDWPTKRADGQRAEIRTCTSVAFSGFQGGRRGSNFRGLLQRKNDTSLLRDEQGKIPLARRGCSPNIAQRHWNPAREPHHLVGFTPEVT